MTGPAHTGQWYIGGTDLGIMWDDGAGHVLTLFGDTFDDQAMTTGWRFNTLLRTVDNDLSDGLQFDEAVISPGGVYADNTWWSPTAEGQRVGATQAIRDPGFLGLFGSTTTIIPTAAVEVDGVQYANVMSVRTWDTPGRWTTNWSAIAYSEDGGKTWTVDPDTVRSSGWLRSSTPYVPGNQNFQQGAFVKAPEADPETGINYVYSYGTPSGRGGSAYLARVPEGQIRDLDAYEYWAGEDRGWVANDPSAAVPVIGATNQSPPPSGFIGSITKAINDFLGGIVVGGLVGGNVSEMSVQYNEYLDQYVVLYTDGGNNVVMRVSDAPQGEWSDSTVLVANNPLAGDTGMYAPMIHPWSGTEKLGSENTHILYYNVSYWDEYNVRLMQTDLSPRARCGIRRDDHGVGDGNLSAARSAIRSRQPSCGQHRERCEHPARRRRIPAIGGVDHDARQPGPESSEDQLHGVDRGCRAASLARIVDGAHRPCRQVWPCHSDPHTRQRQRQHPDRDQPARRASN